MATFQVNGVDISRYTIVYGTNEAIQAVYDYGAPRDENDNVITPTFYYRGDCVRDAGILRDTISAKLGVTLPAISDQSPKAEYEIILGGADRPEAADVSELPEPIPMHCTLAVRGSSLVFRCGCSTTMRHSGRALKRYICEHENIELSDGDVLDLSCMDIDTFPRAVGTNLRVGTSNIAATYNWGGYSEIALEHRKNIFLGEIRALDADVLALQEVDELWYEVLDTLTEYETVEPTILLPELGIHANLSTLIFKKSKFRKIASGLRPFDTCYREDGTLSKYAYIRNVTWVVLEDKETGARCLFTNSHWDWKQEPYTDKNGVKYRIYQDFQGGQHGEWTRELCAEYDCPAFGMADFNCREVGSISFPTYLAKGGLENTRNYCLRHNLMLNDLGSTHYAFRRMLEPPYAACDQIVYTPDPRIELLAYRTIVENCQLDLSDHVPRYVDVCLKK